MWYMMFRLLFTSCHIISWLFPHPHEIVFWLDLWKINHMYVRQHPVIRSRRIGCLFKSSTSRGTSGQEYELCETSPVSALHLALMLCGFRNDRTCRNVQSVVLVYTNTLTLEADVVTLLDDLWLWLTVLRWIYLHDGSRG
jgi:hypothetical protein